MENAWLHRYAVLVALVNLLVVGNGAYVTSVAAPDTYHRLAAAVSGILVLILALWLRHAGESSESRRLGWIAVAAVAVEAALGSAGPTIMSVAHACVAPLLFSSVVAIAVLTSGAWKRGEEPVADYGWPSLRSLASATPVLVLLQVALGAAFRHQALGVMPHIIGAMLVALFIIIVGAFVTNQFPSHSTLRPTAVAFMVVTAIQVFLGMTAFLMRTMSTANTTGLIYTTVAHVATGNLTLAASVVLAMHVRRNVHRRIEPAQT